MATIGRPDDAALVLVEAEETAGGKHDDWDDVTGSQYHYPNQYKNRVVPGRPFIYYRGIRREGGKRGPAEYFGCGVIGEVRLDPATVTAAKKHQHWFCAVEDYVPFASQVVAKLPDGTFLEQMEHQNLWGVGVREIPFATYERILAAAGVAPQIDARVMSAPAVLAPVLPALAEVKPTFVVDTTEVLKPQVAAYRGEAIGLRVTGRPRRSKHSKILGDRAEAIVYAALKALSVKGLRWLSDEGETPGWDIEYTRPDGRLVAVEVKGTAGAAFASFEMTDAEWRKAQTLRERYVLYLVSNCASKHPVISIIPDPFGRKDFDVVPVLWRVVAHR